MKLHSISIIVLLSLLSCRSYNNNNTSEGIESFESFNKQFHSDSLFQLSRIKFPLGGKQIDAFEERDWTPQNWIMMKEPVKEKVDTSEYKHSLTKSTTKINEVYWVEESGFRVERQFELKDGKWYLTFCNDISL